MIIGSVLANDILVRVVTSNATDARIGAVEALTVGQTVGLKANGQLTAPMIPNHRLPRAMALTAKIRDVFRRPLPQIRGSRFEIAIERIAEMNGSAGMTMFARNPRPQRFVSHLAVCDRVAGMTTETHFGFAEFDRASDCFVEVARFQVFVSGREVQT